MKRIYDKIGRDKIREYLKDCKKVVDLGCGNQKIFKHAIGIDNDLNSSADINENLELGWELVRESYDGICLSHVLEHILDTINFLGECYKGLKIGGKIAIICPDGEAVDYKTLGDSKGTHQRLFTAKTLEIFLKHAGFRNVKSEYYERPYAYNKVRGIFVYGEK